MTKSKKVLHNPCQRQRIEMYQAMKVTDEIAADDDIPDGAWQAMLEDTARQYASDNKLYVDSFDAFMDYLEWSSKRG